MSYPTLAEIKAAQAPKREYNRYLLAGRYIFRPPSLPAAWLLIRLGVTSEGASWLSGAAALAGFVCLLWPGEPFLWSGIVFLNLFNFLDTLDGAIARAMRTRNPYGRFLDTIMWWADMLFWTVVGVTVWRLPGLRLAGDALGVPPMAWLAAGALTAFFADYAAYLENSFDQILRPHWETLLRREGAAITATPTEGKPLPEVAARVLLHNLRVRETHYLLLAAACALGCADAFLAVFLLVNALLVPALLAAYARRGRRIYEAGLGREDSK